MISVHDLHFSFNGKPILDGVTFSVEKNKKMGLVGVNGSGKTILLRLIVEELFPDSGMSEFMGRIGYLPQHPNFDDLTIEQFLSSKLDNKNEAYKMERVLNTLGLDDLEKTQKCKDLSGGQKTRIYLASILLLEPTILILDEPTNNLDLEGLYWLENFLNNFNGTILFTSHDRAFLDKVADKIIELNQGKISEFGGNYSFYKEQKLIQQKSQIEKYKQNQEEIKRLENLIKEKQDRIKQVAKDKGREGEKFEAGFFRNRVTKKTSGAKKAIVAKLSQLGKVDKPETRRSFFIEFAGVSYPNKFILGAKNITKNLGGRNILNNISFSVIGSNHVWIAGSNGSGKTTLLKIADQKLIPEEGNIQIGENVKVGYFSQDASSLDAHKSGLEELKSLGLDETLIFKSAIRLHLTPEDLNKNISYLSRGQIAKIEFIKLLLNKNNLLILDEPTNHLEIDTREDIEQALRNFQGAILVSSHDRYFLEELGIDKTFLLDDGKLKEV